MQEKRRRASVRRLTHDDGKVNIPCLALDAPPPSPHVPPSWTRHVPRGTRASTNASSTLLGSTKFDRREDRVASAVLQARALLALDRARLSSCRLLQRASKEVKGAEETVLTQMLHGAALTLTGRREQGEKAAR